jgi:hypothetical protein
LDEHVASAVAQALRRRGIEARTAGEAGLLGADDAAYLARSRAEGWMIVTHDGIAHCEQGARGLGQLIAALVLLHEVLEPAEMAGQVEFL